MGAPVVEAHDLDQLLDPLAVRLAAEHKQPFDLVLTAGVPVPPASRDATVLLLRFPGAAERDTVATATVPDGLEVRV
ncbi:MAG: hypothetical protein ABR582_17575, partial [Gemmatimonadaceae bacterium]